MKISTVAVRLNYQWIQLSFVFQVLTPTLAYRPTRYPRSSVPFYIRFVGGTTRN